jgi:hypothetical protein
VSDSRLASHVEVAALLRRAESTGGFATVVHRGDRERGSILLCITSRGRHAAFLERVINLDGRYAWQRTGPVDSAAATEVASFLAKRARFDPDIWAIELDIADPERFIAETTSAG